MKKLIISLVLVFGVFSVFSMGAFAAEDGASLYKERCAGCHGADGAKSTPVKGTSQEIEKKLKGYLDGSYGGTKKAVMAGIVKKLSDEQIKLVSAHIATFN
ncbi:c-type cytochrome [Desulfovibrio litoralis]|uniref:Cytochrome c n=1 Tax=Desulfovibrio litoralis DSM 11393 TaxID=1121455 RepID=A0A1M7SNR1_9BACT|nr:c-type cytochrome [Desulfovibrio litoralis]SHN60127.1 cytochrome c [Desulfovibrio litoralis DSM 11393]